MGFNEKNFPSKNAALPIIYYVYYNDMKDIIINPDFVKKEDAQKMKKWLILTFLKGVFGGQSDTILLRIKKLLKNNDSKSFPIDKIINEFKVDPSKNYSFEDAFIDELLQSEYGSKNTFYLLTLFHSNLDYFNQDFHVDHIHNKAKFESNNWENYFDNNTFEAINDKWNRIGNLQLLNHNSNIVKSGKLLEEWTSKEKISRKDLYIDEDTSLDIKDFLIFYENRIKNLKIKLNEILS